jgi:hypothetical protein
VFDPCFSFKFIILVFSTLTYVRILHSARARSEQAAASKSSLCTYSLSLSLSLSLSFLSLSLFSLALSLYGRVGGRTFLSFSVQKFSLYRSMTNRATPKPKPQWCLIIIVTVVGDLYISLSNLAVPCIHNTTLVTA